MITLPQTDEHYPQRFDLRDPTVAPYQADYAAIPQLMAMITKLQAQVAALEDELILCAAGPDLATPQLLRLGTTGRARTVLIWRDPTGQIHQIKV